MTSCRKARHGGIMTYIKAIFLTSFLLLSATSCDSGPSPALPPPFTGGSFPLNTQMTTAYGPAWADVTTSTSDWITCFGPYALCYYANCTEKPNSYGMIANCSCYETFGTNYVDINAILNNDVYNETKTFCDANPGECHKPNQAPVCASLSSGDFMSGADRFSTFSFYRAAQEPIGSTDCTSQPALYAGCMTAPCYNPTTSGTDNTTLIECQCPTYNGPFQVGLDNLSCDDSPMIYSAAYDAAPPPSGNPCDKIDGCIPDAPEDSCGCPLETPGTTTIPAGSGVNCTTVCQEYNTCFGTGATTTNIQVGYTCDATICTSTDAPLLITACNGLQDCDLSEIFKAETAAGCSCCASQLCNCSATTATENKIFTLNAAQRTNGETPQCDVNGTLCGVAP